MRQRFKGKHQEQRKHEVIVQSDTMDGRFRVLNSGREGVTRSTGAPPLASTHRGEG